MSLIWWASVCITIAAGVFLIFAAGAIIGWASNEAGRREERR